MTRFPGKEAETHLLQETNTRCVYQSVRISGMQYAGEQQGAAWSQKVPVFLAMVLKGDFGVFNPVFTSHETNIKGSCWNVASTRNQQIFNLIKVDVS